MSAAFTPVPIEPAPDEHLGDVWRDHCYRHPSRQPDCWWCMVPNPWITRFERYTTDEMARWMAELAVPPPPEPIITVSGMYRRMLELQGQFTLFGRAMTVISDDTGAFAQYFRSLSPMFAEEVEDEEGFCYWRGGISAHRWEAARDKVPQI